MYLRPTKITKFFPKESTNDPLGFYGKTTSSTSTNSIQQEIITEEKDMPNKAYNSFDHFPIALVTQYIESKKSIDYCLFINNLKGKYIYKTIQDIQDETYGDLQCLFETLQYIVYHPSLFQIINKQKIVLYTNSGILSTIFTPNSSILQNNDYSKLYFKIQGLLKCIKQISIEQKDHSTYPVSEAIQYLKRTN